MGIIARQSIKASIVTYIGVGIGAINVLFLLPKFVSPDTIGLINTIQKIALLLAPILAFGTNMTLLKFLPKYRKDDSSSDSGLIYTAFLLMLFSILFSGVFYFLFKDKVAYLFIEKAPKINDFLILPFFISIFIVFNQFLSSISNSAYRIVVPSLLTNSLSKFSNFIIVLSYAFLALTFERFVNFYLLCYYVVPFCLLILYVILVIKPNVQVVPFSRVKEIFLDVKSYSIWMTLTSGSGILVFSIDSIMISSIQGTNSTGIYTIAFFIATLINIPKRMISNISLTLLAKEMQKNNMAKVAQLYKESSANLIFIGFLFFILIWINLPDMYQLMPNGSIFGEGSVVVLLIGLSMLIDMSLGVNKQIIEVSSFYRYNLLTTFLLAISTIIFNILLIDKMGISGAALASLLAIIIYNLFSFLIVYYKLKIVPFEKKHILFIVFAVLFFLVCNHFNTDLGNPFLNIFVKSCIISVVVIIVGFCLTLSTTLNDFVDQKILKK